MPDARSEPIIALRRVSYVAAGGKTLLSDIDLAVARGETLVLLGRSGSGKTTTLKLINRLLDPTGGEIVVEGTRTTDWDPIRLRRRIGYVIQEVGLLPHLSVIENVGLVPRLAHWELESIEGRAREILDLVGLPPDRFGARAPRELSGGQRQRVGVARALAADPAILLLDEPFGALDPITRADMQREFRALAARLGKTIVFVTHDVREALLLATRIALLQEGKLVFAGTPREFLRAEEDEVRAFARALEDPVGRADA